MVDMLHDIFSDKTIESSSPGEFHSQALTGRVEGWRGTHEPVSKPRHDNPSVRISRTRLSLLSSPQGLWDLSNWQHF